MAKATAKVPTTGKEDLSGWEKKVDIAAPSITFIKIRFAPRRVDASDRRSLVNEWVGTRQRPSLSVTRGLPDAPSQALLLFIAAVLIDILGVLDQSMPALDCIYGPASAALMKKLFNSKAGAAVAMVEESVPGLDWIPTATITWCAWTYACWTAEAKQKKQAAKAKKHDVPVATPVG